MTQESELLKKAVAEIKGLRRQNEIMSARLGMFDSINAMFHAQLPTQHHGMSPDVCWEIEQHLEKSKSVPPKPESGMGTALNP